MSEKIYLEILDSYKIGPSELIIVILQSPGYALKRGYTLESEGSAKRWTIINRYVELLTKNEVSLFEEEELAYIKSKPRSSEREEFSEKYLERERKGEFMYRLQGIGHKMKPEQGEKLVLRMT